MSNIYKKLRKENGLTQEELASKLHVTQTTISKWEQGRVIPDITTLELIADFFNVTIDFLLGRNNNTTKSLIEDNSITIYARGGGVRKYKLSKKKLEAIQALLDDDNSPDDVDI